jgi:cytochrome c peroxidase
MHLTQDQERRVAMRPQLHRILAIAIVLSVPADVWFGAPVLENRAGTHDALAAEPIEADFDAAAAGDANLTRQLAAVLRALGFTGMMEASLENRLGRPVDRQLAELGRLLWFDTITGLNDDNSCGGCHSPTNGFGDTQSIAIGIDNNNLVGPNRSGPRNQRRTPIVINNVFYPSLMWNSRFASLSQNPFDNRAGFSFPPPEGLSLSHLDHLLQSQAFIPPTERNEVAGFEFPGDNFAIRAEVLNRLNAIPEYRRLFGRSFPVVRHGAPITFEMFGRAIAEFEFTLAFTGTPLDRFARGDDDALSASQKRGALLFFGKAGCVGCHAVSGTSNEMFSDFRMHVIGVPQIAPAVTNSVFDGPGANEDFGLEQVTGDPEDRYAFRTSPLRNLAVQPAFMHNGCFTTLEDAVRHHLDVFTSARGYSPDALDEDLRGPLGPIEPVLERVDPLLAEPIALTDGEFQDLVAFLREGLLDPRALPKNLTALIPDRVPSGRPAMIFETTDAVLAAAGTSGGSVGTTARSPSSADPVTRLTTAPPARGAPLVLKVHAVQAGTATLRLYDVEGRLVRTVLNQEWLSAGDHAVAWDGRDQQGGRAASGVYFAYLRMGPATSAQRIVRIE